MPFNPSQSLCSAFPGPCSAVPVEPFEVWLLGWEEVQQQWWLLSCPRVGLSGQKKCGFPSAELRKSREVAPFSGAVEGVTKQLKCWAVVAKSLSLAPWPQCSCAGAGCESSSPGVLQELLGGSPVTALWGQHPAAAKHSSLSH